ncbi:MAG: hypothetical protein HKM04_01350 [Legionellales bacterium]|nr:hypothetical protein [Legionellales bacterium]
MKVELRDHNLWKDQDDLYHLSFSCKDNGIDVTEQIFKQICDQATVNKNPLKWHDVDSGFRLAFNKDSNTMEFVEKTAGGKALDLLPSKLSRNWNLIHSDESERLSKLITISISAYESDGSDNDYSPSP